VDAFKIVVCVVLLVKERLPVVLFIRQIVIDVGNYYWYGELLFTWVMVMITLKASPLP
jgi:hypothetical protein